MRAKKTVSAVFCCLLFGASFALADVPESRLEEIVGQSVTVSMNSSNREGVRARITGRLGVFSFGGRRMYGVLLTLEGPSLLMFRASAVKKIKREPGRETSIIILERTVIAPKRN